MFFDNLFSSLFPFLSYSEIYPLWTMPCDLRFVIPTYCPLRNFPLHLCTTRKRADDLQGAPLYYLACQSTKLREREKGSEVFSNFSFSLLCQGIHVPWTRFLYFFSPFSNKITPALHLKFLTSVFFFTYLSFSSPTCNTIHDHWFLVFLAILKKKKQSNPEKAPE